MPSLSAGECRVRICADAAGAPPVEEALRAALALIKGDGPMLRLPIYMHLLNGLAYDSGALRIAMAQPECFERLAIRVTQHDPAKGCIDPDVLAADDGRDFVVVTLVSPPVTGGGGDGGGGGCRTLRLPAFWAHLVERSTLWDPEACTGPQSAVWADGMWTGGLVWDSALAASELLLRSPAWCARVRGSTCVELGSGLGLPGLVCHALGASAVMLADPETSSLCTPCTPWT